MVEEYYGTRYQSGSFSLINVGSGFPLPAKCCAFYNAALLRLCCFVLPSLLSGSVFVLGVRGWQDPGVACLLLDFNAFSLLLC